MTDSHILNDFALDINGQLWGFGTNARGLLLPEEIWPEDFVPIMDQGNLVDLGSGEELLDGIVEKTLVRENTLWADGGYALGPDHALERCDRRRLYQGNGRREAGGSSTERRYCLSG